MEFDPPVIAVKISATSSLTEEDGKTVKTVILSCEMPEDGKHDDKTTFRARGLTIEIKAH